MAQLERYLAGLGLNSGWLVIFHQRLGLPSLTDHTTTKQAQSASGRAVTVIRG